LAQGCWGAYIAHLRSTAVADARQVFLLAFMRGAAANIPPPTAEERHQIVALMRAHSWLAHQQSNVYALGIEAVMDTMEMQLLSQRQQAPAVATRRDACAEVNQHRRYVQEVNQLIQQMRDLLSTEQRLVAPPLPPSLQATYLHEEQAQPTYEGVEHVQSTAPQRPTPVPPTCFPQFRQRPPSIESSTGYSTRLSGQNRSQHAPVPPRRTEVPPTSLASVSFVRSPPSSPELPHAVSTDAGPEAMTRITPIGRHNQREGQVPNTSSARENHQSRGRRRARRRTCPNRSSAQEAQATVEPHPSRERALNARSGIAGPTDSPSVTRGATTAMRPSLGRARRQDMAQEVVNYLKFPTAARAA